MTRTIFVNLPVADVARAAAFYTALGFERDARFSTARGAAMQWSAGITVMLLDHELFATLTPKRIIDPFTETGALLALGLGHRDEVDAITRAALAAGGRELHEPEDLDFMYSRAFEDRDGHGWGPFAITPDEGAGA